MSIYEYAVEKINGGKMDMNVAVRYLSKSGNTKKLAEQIAKIVGCEAMSIPNSVDNGTDILFLGASVYWGGIDSQVKKYIKTLDPKKIKRVVVFSTSAMSERAFPALKKLLTDTGIQVDERNFYCRGEFKMMHKGKPDAKDLDQVTQFAKEIMK